MSFELDPKARARLSREVFLARAVILWERAAGVWTPLLLGLMAGATIGLWGGFEALENGLRPFAFAAIMFAAAVPAALALWRTRVPTRREALERIEADSGMVHAPLTSAEDEPAAGDPELWALNRNRVVEAARTARVGRPHAGMAAADPLALRYALLLAAALAVWADAEGAARRAAPIVRPLEASASASVGAVAAAGDRTLRSVSAWVAGIQSRAAMSGEPRMRPAESRP